MTNRFEDNNSKVPKNKNKKNKIKKPKMSINKKNPPPPPNLQDLFIKSILPMAMMNPKKESIENIELKHTNNLIPKIKSINNLDDLIELSELAYMKKDEGEQYILPVQRLCKIKDQLKELRDIIGLDDIKNKLIEQIIYLITHCDEKDPPLLHTIIDGPPGTGKTKIARIIGKIISSIGYLKKNPSEKNDLGSQIQLFNKDSIIIDLIEGTENKQNKENKNNKENVKYVTRGDLVGGYLGQTAIKTQKAIDSASGGVLIIDEAYSLGGTKGETDLYSQECIDTLVSNLSENRSFVCIILGYKEEINESFISKNKGLESRFPFRYTIKDYGIEQLIDILKGKIAKDGYNFDDEIFNIIRKKSSKDFKFLGRDMETLWFKIKICQTKRIFLKYDDNKILEEDVKKGLESFFSNKDDKMRDDMKHLSFYL